MWVYNSNDPLRRHFGNNICAFHIGNGLILSVSHNLRTESGFVNSMDEPLFQNEIIPLLNQPQAHVFSQYYTLDATTNKRYANPADTNTSKIVSDTFKQIKFDTRWVTLSEKNICKPHLIIQFRDSQFYGDSQLTGNFDSSKYFPEPALNRHTYLIELELQKAFYSNDIALYKIVNTPKEVIDKLPSATPDFSVLDDDELNLYCLQSSSGSFLGRLLNNAKIEGYSDNWSSFNDRVGGNYVMEGLRYLIRGYFRFGSSGAPYLFYDASANEFKVNAVQSEASPIQLSINNSREGNYQYVNAIASPLRNIQEEIETFIAS